MMSNTLGLQEGTYRDVRAQFGLPAQMACSVPRQVGARYKALWTKVQANAAARAAGHPTKRYRGLDQAPPSSSPTLSYQLGHDYGFTTGQQVSILTLEGRSSVPSTGYNPHVACIQQGARLGAAKRWYDKPHQQVYLLVSVERELPDPSPEQHQRIAGVDGGQRDLAVATDTQNHMQCFAGASACAQADHDARLRKRLQHTGTRSATRRLIVSAGRERRLKHERHHLISRRSVDAYPHSLIGLDDLTHIRERRRRKRKRTRTYGKNGRNATGKQRRANRHAAQWAVAELQGFVAYKALLCGTWLCRWTPTRPARPARAAGTPRRTTALRRACCAAVRRAIWSCMRT
jgi:hypothetical protein